MCFENPCYPQKCLRGACHNLILKYYITLNLKKLKNYCVCVEVLWSVLSFTADNLKNAYLFIITGMWEDMTTNVKITWCTCKKGYYTCYNLLAVLFLFYKTRSESRWVRTNWSEKQKWHLWAVAQNEKQDLQLEWQPSLKVRIYPGVWQNRFIKTIKRHEFIVFN